MTARRGFAGFVRSRRPWWHKAAVVLGLMPLWLTSEVRQSSIRRRTKGFAIAAVWIMTLAFANAMVPASPALSAAPLADVSRSVGRAGVVRSAAGAVSGVRAAPTIRSTTVGWPKPPSDVVRATVVRVVDGDTVVLSGISVGSTSGAGRRARLIGIDTPEVYGRVDCYGGEASAFTKRELDGRKVLITFDVQKTDRYRRALVYIWTTDGVLFNARLAAEGYASQMTIPPNVRYAELYSRLVREARDGRRGLWGSACAAR